jgi:hypothetical protein
MVIPNRNPFDLLRDRLSLERLLSERLPPMEIPPGLTPKRTCASAVSAAVKDAKTARIRHLNGRFIVLPPLQM